MTHATASNRLALSPSRCRWFRLALRGLLTGAVVLGLGWVAVAVPIASPPTIAAPLVKGLYLPVNDTARTVYVKQLLDDGWELRAPVEIDES